LVLDSAALDGDVFGLGNVKGVGVVAASFAVAVSGISISVVDGDVGDCEVGGLDGEGLDGCVLDVQAFDDGIAGQ